MSAIIEDDSPNLGTTEGGDIRTIEAKADAPQECPECHSNYLMLSFIGYKSGKSMLMAKCEDCGRLWSLPQRKNLTKRTRTAQEKWVHDVKNRDGNKCVICGCTMDLEAHHVIQFSEHPELGTVLGNGLTLCKKHHDMAHPWRKHTHGVNND